ncbi:MAG: tetratricopeptide repeat protein [Deltaproteobacteria bacterium]|nr:tetratricopeptide repeat protein [Deltaproteobacteria bacterium]
MTRESHFPNWKDHIFKLEEVADSFAQGPERAEAHLRIARLWEDKYLQKAKAIAHYQQAFKADPGSLEALRAARRIYWEMGRLGTIDKLVALEMQITSDAQRQADLYRELVDAMLLLGQNDRAELACIECADRAPDDVRCVEIADDLAAKENWAERATGLERSAHDDTASADRLFRAAILHGIGGSPPETVGDLLVRAVLLDPSHVGAVYMLERDLVDAGRLDDLSMLQGQIVENLTGRERAAALYQIGARWLLRHSSPERAVPMLDQACRLDPSLQGLPGFLYEYYVESGSHTAAADLLEAGLECAEGRTRIDLLELAGDLWGRILGDEKQAERYRDELSSMDSGTAMPGHFSKESEMAKDGGRDQKRKNAKNRSSIPPLDTVVGVEPERAAAPAEERAAESAVEPAKEPSIPPELAVAMETAQGAEAQGPEKGIAAWEQAWGKSPGHEAVMGALMRLYAQTSKWTQFADFLKKQTQAMPDGPAKASALLALGQLYETHLKQDVMAVNAYQAILKFAPHHHLALDAAIAKYEAMSRWPDLVKVLKAKGEAAESKEDKVDIFLKVAQLFLQRFSNQAEAIKAFEEVLNADPHHDQAITFLKEMYEKRRDWEKLVGILKRETEKMGDGPERAQALVKIAEMATDKLKKPAVCIELWEAVLAQDPENGAAFNNLAGLYERGKEWESYARIVNRQIEIVADAAERAALLVKLGTVYGDKLNDDGRAIEAWKALLAMDPDDRRAQEQLKKRYLALQAWDELEAFFAATEKWDEFIRVLEREAERQDSALAARIGLQFKIAELWRDKKSRIDRAARCYEAVLQLDPDNMEAAEALIPILETEKNPAKLADVLEVKLRHAADATEKLVLRQRIAHIAEEELQDFERAFTGFVEAFTQTPEDGGTQEDLERSAGRAGGWEKAVEVIRGAIETVDAGSKQELILRLARILDAELGRPEEALAYYGAILSDDPKNPRAVSALEKIYAQMGRYQELLDIYARRIEMAADDEERKEIFYNQALLWEEEIDDRVRAIAVYGQIIEMAGDELRALAALDRLYLAEQRWSDLADVIERELSQGVMDQTAELELKFRLGQVSDEHLGNKARALECYREILAIDPAYEPAVAALEGLLADAAQRGEAAHILAPLYEERGDFEKLVEAIGILVECSSDNFEKFEHLMRVGAILAEKLASPERSFVAYSRAFKINPGEPRCLGQLEAITSILDSWKELVDLLEEGGRNVEDQAVAKGLWLRAARLLDTQLDAIDRAVAAYNNALKSDPQDPEAIAALEQIYGRTERWPDLIDILRAKVEMTADAGEKEQIYTQMAVILEEMLGRPEDAVGCLKEIINFDPGNLRALQALDKLFGQLERWSDLADNLQQQMGLGGDPETIVGLKLRLADIQEVRLAEVSAAVDIYREIITLEPENARAVEALERIIERPELKQEIAQVLEPIYRGLGQWDKLVGVYEIMIQGEGDVARRVELIRQIAVLYETAGDEPEKAFHTLGRALREDASDEQTQLDLERLARVLVLYEDLATMYAARVEQIENPELAAAYHLKIARIFEENLQDLDNAIKHYLRVLDIDPMHMDAATALERAYQITENYAELAGIYLRKVEMVSDPAEQKDFLFNASKIYEEILEKPEKAIEVYTRILGLDEEDLKAIGQLEALYLRLERWQELQDIYNRKVDLLSLPDEKKEILYVLGAMYERELKDVKKAIETYQRILEFDPDDFQAVQRLDMLFTETEAWHDLLSILEREVELATDSNETVSFKFRVGELYVRHLKDIPRAVECFRDILTSSPGHAPSIRMLEELIAADNEAMMIAEVLEPLYQDLAEWRKLIAVLEVKLRHTEEAWQKVELLHQIAGLLESDLHLDSPKEAFDAYARALDEDNLNEKTLAHLEDLAAQTGRWGDLASLFDAQFAKVVEAERAVGLGLRVAAIYEEKMDQTDLAIERFQKVLTFDSENRAAIVRLDRLFHLTERWNDLAAILQKEAIIASDPAQSLEIQFRLGRLYQQEIGDMDKAVDVYRDILAADPDHDQTVASLELLFAENVKRADIVEILEPLYRMHEQWQKLVALYEAQLQDMTEIDDRVRMMQRIAEVYEERLVEPIDAFNWYCKAFAVAPFEERAGEEIERLARASSAWAELADLYQDILVRSEDAAVQRFVAKRLARVAEVELSDVARAEQAYRGCLQLGGDDLEVLKALDRIYTQYMEWERLVEILGMLAKVAPSDTDRVEYIHRVGTIYETQLDEIEKARQCYHRVVDKLDPGHRESLARLEVVYADHEAWPELYDIYNRMKETSDSDAAQADLLAKMATIAAECLADVPKAVSLWRNVIDLRGEDPMALDALADLYARQESWSDLVDVLERAVSVADEPSKRVGLYSQLGLVWGECLGRDRNALENWENVLGIDAENLPALKAIAGIHEANKDWGPLIETIERVIAIGAHVFEAEEIKGYYAKLGGIFSDILEQPRDAIAAWRRAADVDPSDRAPLEALEKLYTGEAMWEELVDVLGGKARLLEGDERVETLLKQAKVHEDRLSDPLGAKSSYRKILETSPLHPHAFARMVEIMTEEQTWEDLTQVYSRRLNYVTDTAERVNILHEAAKIYEDKLSQPENAFLVMQKAFEEDYLNDMTAEHLERLASLTGKWNDLLASCNQVLQGVQNREVQLSLCLKIGKWYADELGHPEYAIAYYQQVLQIDSNNVRALKLMGELYRGTKQWPELVEVLNRAVEAEDLAENKKDILVDLGQIYEDYLDDVPEARKAYKKALDIDPGLDTALNALERIFVAAKNWRELIPILRRKIEALKESEDIVDTRMRIGEIFEDSLDDAQSAIDEYREVLTVDQGHLPALKGLERLYSKLERWQDLMDVLEIELEHATSERERISLLTRIANMLEEEFVKPEKAAERYEQVLEIDPGHESSLQALERIYRQSARWRDLISAFERHVDVTRDRDVKINLCQDVGKVYAADLNDAERAIEAYRRVLDIDPSHETALDEMAKLQVRSKDWAAAHDTLRRLAETVSDSERKVDLYFRLGQLNEENLEDRTAAVEHLRSALDIDSGHLPSLELLRKIHIDEAEWVAAARVMEAEQEHTENARQKSKLQYELANVLETRLDDKPTAIKWYEEALRSDPDNQEAAEPLVSVYVEAKRWPEAEMLLDTLIRLGAKRPPVELAPFHRQLGLVADKLGNLDKALKAYQTAYDTDTAHLPTLLALADVFYRKEDWDKAFKFYQMVLVHHRDKQGPEETVEIFFRLGYIKAKVNERRKALNMFDKALELDPNHKPTLGEVIVLHEEQKNYEQVIHFKKILIGALEDPDERFHHIIEIGDIWQEKLKNPQKAISAYNEALDQKPDDRTALHKLLPLYQTTKQWQKVVEVIQKVADLEEENDKLGRLYYSMGVIYRDEIKSAEDAVECFNKSLDASTENLKSFEAIDRILTQRKDWKNLERNYRKMLHRIAGKGRKDIETNLWHFLGEIYRTRMQQFEPAAEAFKMAASLEPDNVLRHEILAELFMNLPDKLKDAVAEHQFLIKKNPYRVDSYKALRKLYFDNRQYDKAWCLCATLAFLKKADAEEQQFFEQYRTRGMVRAQARLDNERWIKDLFHPDESVYLGKIFELVTRAVRAVKVQPIKAFGLKKNQKRPVNDTMTFSKTFFYAAQVINLPVVPDLYIQEDKPGGLNFAVTDPMASACGASLLSGYSPQDLLFIVTKHLSYCRPEHYIRWVLPTHAELKMLLLAALKIGATDFRLPEDKSGVLAGYVDVLRSNLTPMEVENLSKVVARFIKSGEIVDIKKWVNAVELTGCRAGFLLANDLEVAARMIQAETGTVDEIPPKEKIKELVLFSISEEYFKLRETLGISIGA